MIGIVLKSGGLQERTACGNEFTLSTAWQVKFPGGLAKPKQNKINTSIMLGSPTAHHPVNLLRM